ncbi:hypothetical protein [Fictibacillus macauensis]|uniref:hypothetical protein n=1 Tax=Fictibacillus macauensis TaxID=245160 RepID=UPI00030512D3|nr:hypothetical protein [Fictibacillus macauensis]
MSIVLSAFAVSFLISLFVFVVFISAMSRGQGFKQSTRKAEEHPPLEGRQEKMHDH